MQAVLRAIVHLSPQYIKFPYTTKELQNVKEDFVHTTGFPNVIGTIDCTHVAIWAAHQMIIYMLTEKNYHSLNVQLICNACMAILNAIAR